MPDDYGNLRPISVPLIPWLQTFDRGEHVRVVAGELQGRSGTVTKTDGQVWLLLDDDTGEQAPFEPGELRRSS